MDFIKNIFKFNIVKAELFIILNIYFVLVLFNISDNIFTKIKHKFLSFDKISESNVILMKDSFDKILTNNSISNTLDSYGIFFYIDHPIKRVAFIDKNTVNLKRTIFIQEDKFYEEMLSYHNMNLCYLKYTNEIDKNSLIYNSLLSSNDIAFNKIYISCPLYINNDLVGYLGGVHTDDKQQKFYVKFLPVIKSAVELEVYLQEFLYE